jgi:hypothetical protein
MSGKAKRGIKAALLTETSLLGDKNMPNWLVPLVCLIALVGFIGFAFRQGTKVRPDRNNTNFGPSNNDGQVDGTHSGFDGHAGS